jgi:hypothetical protein
MPFFDVENEYISQYFPDGLSYEDIVQILFNDKARQVSTNFTGESLNTVGIIRRVREIEDLSEINSVSSKDEILYAHTKTCYAVNIEVRYLTETYKNLVNEFITEEQFYNSLPELIVSPSLANSRIPQRHEVILLNYERPNDFLSVKFAGFPFEKPFLDPNLNSYVLKNRQPTKKAFPNGE